jgi:hypothetical protein
MLLQLGLIFFFVSSSTGVWTQDLLLASQAIYHLNYNLSLFALVIFQIGSYTFA